MRVGLPSLLAIIVLVAGCNQGEDLYSGMHVPPAPNTEPGMAPIHQHVERALPRQPTQRQPPYVDPNWRPGSPAQDWRRPYTARELEVHRQREISRLRRPMVNCHQNRGRWLPDEGRCYFTPEQEARREREALQRERFVRELVQPFRDHAQWCRDNPAVCAEQRRQQDEQWQRGLQGRMDQDRLLREQEMDRSQTQHDLDQTRRR